MDAAEKQILRAQLLASGVIRYQAFNKSREDVLVWQEIVAEELATLNEPNEALKIRENLRKYGVHVPERPRSVHVDDGFSVESPTVIGDMHITEVCNTLTKADTKGPVVYPTAVNDSQVQENPDMSNREEVRRTWKNMYFQNGGTAAVHPVIGVGREIQQNSVDELPPSLTTGFDKGLTSSNTHMGSEVPVKGPTGSGTWRRWSYNRVPPAIEEAVFEKFQQGWSKSRLAREFRLNRRTIIRVCRRRESDLKADKS